MDDWRGLSAATFSVYLIWSANVKFIFDGKISTEILIILNNW